MWLEWDWWDEAGDIEYGVEGSAETRLFELTENQWEVVTLTVVKTGEEVLFDERDDAKYWAAGWFACYYRESL